MNYIEYQDKAGRTCPSLDLNDNTKDLAHMGLGLGSELAELLDAFIAKDKVNIGEEVADCFWYLANYCSFRGYSLKELDGNPQAGKNVDYYVFMLQDLIKKNMAYGKHINNGEEIEYLSNIKYCLETICIDAELDVFRQLDKNIAKLELRFPHKFTQEKAINRDTDAERKILEQ